MLVCTASPTSSRALLSARYTFVQCIALSHVAESIVGRRPEHLRLRLDLASLFPLLAASAIQLKGSGAARDRTKRTIQIRVRSEFLESKENHEKAFLRSSSRPKRHDGAARKERKGKQTALRERGVRRSEFFQNSGIFARRFRNFGKFEHFLKYRRNSDQISSESEQKSMKRFLRMKK